MRVSAGFHRVNDLGVALVITFFLLSLLLSHALVELLYVTCITCTVVEPYTDPYLKFVDVIQLVNLTLSDGGKEWTGPMSV